MVDKRCRECDKAIVGPLDLHFKSFHMGEVRPYLCLNDFCKLAFAERRNLEKHEILCGKEKLYACGIR